MTHNFAPIPKLQLCVRLPNSKIAYYMANPIPKYYYEEIKKHGSSENVVDNFWNNTLDLYFTHAKLYGMELEQRSLEGVLKQRADFSIRNITKLNITNGNQKKVVFMGDKTKGHESQSSKWSQALEQLTNYMNMVRSEPCGKDILYGAVTIGTYVRFYSLMPGEQTMQNYPSAVTEKSYELKSDEEHVHQILNSLVSNTSS